MKKRASRIFIGIFIFCCVFLVLFTVIYIVVPKKYTSAKASCDRVLQWNKDKMEQISIEVLDSKKEVSGRYKKYSYYSSLEEGTVSFEIGAQGMLGGQYWSLVFSEDGTFFGEDEKYLSDGKFKSLITRAERIDEHWWFLWEDYDCTELSYK